MVSPVGERLHRGVLVVPQLLLQLSVNLETQRQGYEGPRSIRKIKENTHLQTWPDMSAFPVAMLEWGRDAGVEGIEGCSGCSLSRRGRESSKEW